VLLSVVALLFVSLQAASIYDDLSLLNFSSRMNEVMPMKLLQHEICVAAERCPTIAPKLTNLKCVNGMAGTYPCDGYDLQAFVPLAELGSTGDGNDIWGWTDPLTNREYAIFCAEDGTSFIDVTDSINPVVLTFLPTHTVKSLWRDAKVYNNYAFIVSEALNHGMQVFDLKTLRGVTEFDASLGVEAAFYDDFGSAHNIAINEDTGFAYAVGSKTCNSGLHIVNIQDPTKPVFAGCYSIDGYVHDTQCVVYNGPDLSYVNREICFCFDEDTVTVVDVTDKSDMTMLSRTDYPDNEYTHQGWLTTDQTYVISNDELDELYGTAPNHEFTRSLIWDFSSLTNPVRIGAFHSSETAIDHNLYINGTTVFESNYCAGLRVLDSSNIASGTLTQIGFFDVAPDCDTLEFQGTWSNYPYFSSGNIVVSSIERGLFIVRKSD